MSDELMEGSPLREDTVHWQAEKKTGDSERKKTKLSIRDTREELDLEQVSKLEKRLELDGVVEALAESKRFLSDYSSVLLEELSITIVNGEIGKGTIKGKTIELQLPVMPLAIKGIKESLEPTFGELSDEKSEEIALSLSSSTILHEGIHGLLESKPDSKFHRDLEKASGIEDPGAERATLLDEGIAYALQGIFAQEVEPIGSLVPTVREDDKPEVKKRKLLGEKLRPGVVEYLRQGRKIDVVFLSFAEDRIKEVQPA